MYTSGVRFHVIVGERKTKEPINVKCQSNDGALGATMRGIFGKGGGGSGVGGPSWCYTAPHGFIHPPVITK